MIPEKKCGGGLSATRDCIDLAVLSVISSFQDVRGWKLRKIGRDLMQPPKPNSFYDDVMQVFSIF